MSPVDPQRLPPVRILQRYTESCVTAVDVTAVLHIFEKIAAAQTIVAAEVVVHLYTKAVLIHWRDVRQCSRAVNRYWISPKSKNSPRILAKAVRTWVHSSTAGVGRIYQRHRLRPLVAQRAENWAQRGRQ